MIQVHYFKELNLYSHSLSKDKACFHVFIGTTFEEYFGEKIPERTQVAYILRWMKEKYPTMKLIYKSIEAKSYRFTGNPRLQVLIYANGESQ